MTEQELAEFCRTHPFLYHVTDQHALGSIEKHGLLTAKEMDDCFMKMSKGARRRFRKRMGFPGDLEDRLSGLGMLAARLQALRTAAWAVGAARPEMKNEKVFFFVTRKAAEEMAEEYRNHPIPRVVLKIDTRSFLEAHLDSVELSAHCLRSVAQGERPRGGGARACRRRKRSGRLRARGRCGAADGGRRRRARPVVGMVLAWRKAPGRDGACRSGAWLIRRAGARLRGRRRMPFRRRGRGEAGRGLRTWSPVHRIASCCRGEFERAGEAVAPVNAHCRPA